MSARSCLLYLCGTWRQLAAVAEPARGCGRILIIASAGVEPAAQRRNRHHLRWGGHRLAVPDRESAEVDGLQNTVTNLGASPGTALVGAVLIARWDNISIAVGRSYNRPSGGRRPLRRKRRKCREPSLTPITNCPL
jgi:hypothetical protein